jgi:predicted RNase H-like HicB family nuclease
MKELTISQDSEGEWLVTCGTIPGFVAKGKTQTEAILKMKAALSLYFPCGDCEGTKIDMHEP